MTIETNLNQSPFFDDYNENKDFHRILFRPGFAVQARELTQMQTILQKQVERFGDHIFVDGTVVTGVGLTTDNVDFVKLRDKDANNRVVLVSDFNSGGSLMNLVAVQASTGMTAKLVNITEGSEAAAPNYLTAHLFYTNSGANNTTKVFADDSPIVFRHAGNNAFVVAANSIQTSSTGLGLKASTTDGIVYHKGHFIRTARQSAIIGKYTTTPSVVLGFRTVESTIDSNQDSSLLDNATGSTNASAPGASRLKLVPTLTSYNYGFANTVNFFQIAKIKDGSVEQRNTKTIYNELGNYIAERIYDTNGDYVVDPFGIRIREHLKKTNSLGRYTVAESGNNSLLVAEIEKGKGYVNGYQVELAGSKYLNMDKATTTLTENAITIGQAYGNYVLCKEVAGTWDFANHKTVSIRDAAQQTISRKNFGTAAAQGSEIGTAKVRAFQWDSGTSGTYNAQYRIYIFDVQMNSGKSFADARSLYINNTSGTDSFADIILNASGNAKIQEGNLRGLVFGLGSKGAKQFTDENGTRDTQWVVRKRLSSVTFATDGTAQFGVGNTATGGTETLNDTGSPISNADERNYIIVSKTGTRTAYHTGNITTISGNTITGSGTAFNTTFKVGDLIRIEDSANTYIERITAIGGATSLSTANTISVTRSGASMNYSTELPAGKIWDLSTNGSISTVSSPTPTATVDLGIHTLNSTFNAEVYYNVNRTDADPAKKTVFKNRYVHLNLGSNPANRLGPWPLGVSDVFNISAVYKGSNTGVTTAGTDVTSHFELDTGMKDAFYDTSYLVKKEDSNLTLAASDGLLVKLDYFGRDTSTGYGFLNVDSYADIIDDDNPGAATSITTQEIPIFVSPTSGRTYDLRDSVDFRPIKKNSYTPSTTGTAAAAPTNPAANTDFLYDVNFSIYTPTPDENFQADVQFYLPRKDRIVVSQRGTFSVIKGTPSRDPKTPGAPGGTMSLGVVDVPVYPSLSPYVAKQYKRPDYQVKLDLDNNRRYTMKDLRGVEQRVKTLEYYSTLNSLENAAKNKQLFSDAGSERFKNGFFVDNFDGHNLADVKNPYYKAAIDKTRKQLRPTFLRRDISLGKDETFTSTNVQVTGDLVTLPYTETAMVDQPYATKVRNPVQELLFNWRGQVLLDPEADNTPDITTLPDVQIDFDGLNETLEELIEATGITNGLDYGTWQVVSGERREGGRIVRDIEQTVIETNVSTVDETISFGNFVQDVSIKEYMRSREINFTGVRMRPNTRVYAYFDDEKVFDYVTPANSTFGKTGTEGANLVTDSTGTVYGVFRIPNDDTLKFRTGTKQFKLQDINDPIVEADVATTTAIGSFTSTPLDIVQRGASVNMKIPQISKDVNVIQKQQWTVLDRDNGWQDPIAQTFSVNISGSTTGVYVTKINLYFKEKSSTYPMTLQIREVDNGFPTDIIVPNGQKTLQPSEISVSSDGSTATTFTFASPVFLENQKDFALVAIPGGNSDDYTMWVSELGGTDQISNTLVSKQPYTGVLFTSSNDNTWSAIQAEDLKFEIYRAVFDTSVTGTLYLENKDLEYLSADNFSGNFRIGENVVAESIITLHGVTGNTAGNYLQVGDVIANASVSGSAANATIRSVITENANGTVVVKVDPLNTAGFTSLASSNGTVNIYGSNFTSGAAQVSTFAANTLSGTASKVYFVHPANNHLHLENSSGGFANGWVRGQTSGAVARVTSVDNIKMNIIVPKVPELAYAKTTTSWQARTTSTSGVIGSTFKDVNLSQENLLTDGEKRIYSKTNESGLTAVAGSKKSLVLKGTLNSTSDSLSPVVDLSRTNSIILANIINNDVTDEHKNAGNAKVRYTSKKIELADGQDAEDMVVFVSAYKPQTTDIDVYAKILNDEDPEDFSKKDWTPLRQVTASNTFSEGFDGTDFKEYEFTFSANTDGDNFLAVASANSHAKLNTGNNNVVSYMSQDGAIYHTYKTYAIKIVMTAAGTNIVPLVRDMRAIALQR